MLFAANQHSALACCALQIATHLYWHIQPNHAHLQLAQCANNRLLDAASPSNLELPEAAEKADLNSLSSTPMPFTAARMSAGSGAASAVAPLLLLMRLIEDARRRMKARAECDFLGS